MRNWTDLVLEKDYCKCGIENRSCHEVSLLIKDVTLGVVVK